jgi:hypothetical protein
MERVLTRKGAVVELAIVTVGVLIALSFDGVRGWMRERSLVEEARMNLATELRANRAAIEAVIKTIPTREQELTRVRDIAQSLLAGRPASGTAELNFELPELTTAAYSSAQLTGAFGLMEYAEVSDYAAVYGFQSTVTELRGDILGQLQLVLSRIWLIDEPKPRAQDLELWKHDLDLLGARLFFLKQLAEQLKDGYAKVLARVDQR